MTNWLELHSMPILVMLPLLAAFGCLLFKTRRAFALLSSTVAIVQLVAVITLLQAFPAAGTGLSYQLAGWGAPLGIDLYVDGLSLILLLATAVLVLVLSIYSYFYFYTTEKAARFWPLWWLLVSGLNCAFVAADAFNIYVALEMIGLASVALVALASSRNAQIAALRYALVSLLGSLFYLLGVAILYRLHGTLSMAELAALTDAGPANSIALLLISVGLMLKTALLPLHFWLPPAHSGAPAPVSAVLSGLVIKASFYLLMRYWLEVLAPAATGAGSQLLGILGTVAIIWGCLAAYNAQRLKILIAYSTVAQLGYLFLLFSLVSAESTDALYGSSAVAAVVYFMVAHAFAKAAMFLSAGNIMFAYGHDEISRLKGLARQQPLSLFTFTIAGVSLIGLPPTGGFIAKWLLLNSAIANGQWWWVAVMLGGGLLAAVYIFRVINLAFVKTDTDSAPATLKRVPTGMTLSGFTLAILAVALGFNAEWLLDLLILSDQPMASLLEVVSE